MYLGAASQRQAERHFMECSRLFIVEEDFFDE